MDAVFETTLEIAFEFETALDIKIKTLFFHFNRSTISDHLARPYLIVFNDVEGNKYRYTLKDIIDNIGYIPIYRLTSSPQTEYSIIDINNKLIPVSPSDKNYATLKSLDEESTAYETSIGLNSIDASVTDMVCSLLDEYEIPYTSDDTKLTLYDSSASYHPVVPFSNRNMTETGFCIIPSPHEFIDHSSIGRFSQFDGSEVTQPVDYHLALIDECPKCEKCIICDWCSFTGTPCPYCDAIITL